MLELYLDKWDLTNPAKIDHPSDISDVYIVIMQDGEKAVLKMPKGKGIKGERLGAKTLNYFHGDGAVQCLNSDDHIQLLTYLDGKMIRHLVDEGHDDQATIIIADVVKRLHKPREESPPELTSLKEYFDDLFEYARQAHRDPHYKWAADLAQDLFTNTTHQCVLHGDIHHENIMNSSDYGWVVIDPKGIYGDPHFDLSNCFNNPTGHDELVTSHKRMNRMADIFSDQLGYDRQRLLEFACAYMALSAAWHDQNNYDIRAKFSLDNSKRMKDLLLS